MVFFRYGFGRPVKREHLKTLSVQVGTDGLLREVTVWCWTFESKAAPVCPGETTTYRVCKVFESYYRCRTGGKVFPGVEGRWSWTGERFSEPYPGDL